MLYEHAVRFFDLPKNPMEKLERTQVTHKPVKILNWNQVQIFIKMPETLGETAAMELLVGHGWRQVEVRHIVAKDVAEISEDTILCHGKEREELAPILPQTQKLLKQMAKGLKPGDQLFISQDGKKKPLGEDGMAQLVTRLLGGGNQGIYRS
jgi:site-specific recombinase XerD